MRTGPGNQLPARLNPKSVRPEPTRGYAASSLLPLRTHWRQPIDAWTLSPAQGVGQCVMELVGVKSDIPLLAAISKYSGVGDGPPPIHRAGLMGGSPTSLGRFA